MLRSLHIKNFALIEDVSIEFEPGLTVITGETGTGKSMIVNALSALCGARIDDLSIRTGKEFLEVSGVFEPTKQQIKTLENSGIEIDGVLIIRRKLTRGKRQTAYINEQVVSLNFLKELTKGMIDLIGQYENQFLFNQQNHLLLLDSFAGLESVRAEYLKDYHTYINLKKEIEELQQAIAHQDEEVELLRFQVDEIEKADLKINEEDELNAEKNLLLTSERRSSLASRIVDLLYESEGSVYEKLTLVKKAFDEISSLDPHLRRMDETTESILSNIDDIYREMSSYLSSIEFSPERLDYVMERLDTFERLKKKYGSTLKEINQFLEVVRRRLNLIENRDSQFEELKAKIEKIKKRVDQRAEGLSELRRRNAVDLKKRLLKVLKQLGMEKASFEVRFEKKELDETGQDDVEFYISTNPGEKLKPLRRIASGGEISRITLGLKTLFSEIDRIPTVVFDEIDIGVGGRVADAVGELMSRVSRHHQIICITHLPQITAFADHHILVTKEIKGNETFTRVKKLDQKMRHQEIARMLAGKRITKKTVEHAREMLEKGKRR